MLLTRPDLKPHELEAAFQFARDILAGQELHRGTQGQLLVLADALNWVELNWAPKVKSKTLTLTPSDAEGRIKL